MKKADKDKIRATLSRVAGHDIGEVKPEFFLSSTKGKMLVALFPHAEYPQQRSGFREHSNASWYYFKHGLN